jgi:hypothetical protein
LPSDIREFTPNRALTLEYAPRTITSIARVAGVVTVTTATAHGMLVGMSIAVQGVVTQIGFNGTYTVLDVTSPTVFTAMSAGNEVSDTTGQLVQTGMIRCLRYNEQVLTPCSTPGVPWGYAFSGALTAVLAPASDGTYPAFTIRYDGEAPETLQPTDNLPIPAEYEPELMMFAAAEVGAMAKDEAQARFMAGVTAWRVKRADLRQSAMMDNRGGCYDRC